MEQAELLQTVEDLYQWVQVLKLFTVGLIVCVIILFLRKKKFLQS